MQRSSTARTPQALPTSAETVPATASTVTPEQQALLLETWGSLYGYRNQIAEAFYRHMTTADPRVRPLFHPNNTTANQGRVFIMSLDGVVRKLPNLGAVWCDMQNLGRRHGDYYKVPADLLGLSVPSFLAALREVGGYCRCSFAFTP